MVVKSSGFQKKKQPNKQCLLNAISLCLNDRSIKHDSIELNRYADNLTTFFALLHETAINLKD